MEHVLDFCPDTGFCPVLTPFLIRQRLVLATLLIGKVLGRRRYSSDRLLLPRIGRVTIQTCFTTVQKVIHNWLVMHIGRCGNNGMDQLGFAIHSNMRFHTKIPLMAFPGLLHLRVD